MAYSQITDVVQLKDVNLVQAADTVLYTVTLPTGHPGMYIHALEQVVTTAAGNTTSAAVKVVVTPSGGQAATKLTGTGLGISAAAGKCTYDRMTSPLFIGPGDKLELQIATTATSTGKANITLIGSRNP